MSKETTFELVMNAVPYPQQITEIDFSTEPDAVRFTWRGTRFRVSNTINVEECKDGTLAGSDKAILLRSLLEKTKALASI